MKTKYYRNGKYSFHSYMKEAGVGWEVGFCYGHDVIFVGNFIHTKEAVQWYSLMNREIRKFSKKFTVGPKFPVSWYIHFAKNHLYKSYYGYLDRAFAQYQREYTSALKKDVRRYNKLKKNWQFRSHFFKAA